MGVKVVDLAILITVLLSVTVDKFAKTRVAMMSVTFSKGRKYDALNPVAILHT